MSSNHPNTNTKKKTKKKVAKKKTSKKRSTAAQSKSAVTTARETASGKEKVPGRPFPPGVSGNPAGRPKGTRHKLSETFLEALYNDFQKHGERAISKVRSEKPDAYLKTIAQILPKELNVKVDPLEELSDADLDRYIQQLASVLSVEIRAGEGAEDETEPTQLQPVKAVRTLQ